MDDNNKEEGFNITIEDAEEEQNETVNMKDGEIRINEQNLFYDKLYDELNNRYLVIISQLKETHKRKEVMLQE